MTAINEHSVSYDEALALLGRALDHDAFADEQGDLRANSWEVRQALRASKRLYAAAQVSASLAIVDELRALRVALTPTTVTVVGPEVTL